jgi:transketolase
LQPAKGKAQITLIATGSEVEIAAQAKKLLESEGITTALVSMPCMDLFAEQDPAYRMSVIDPSSVRIAVEAASPMSWDRWIGDDGAFIGMTTFGASGPYQDLYKHFGITPENVVKAAKARL